MASEQTSKVDDRERPEPRLPRAQPPAKGSSLVPVPAGSPVSSIVMNSPASLVGLQRMAGNSAVAKLVRGKQAPTVVQRDDVATAPAAAPAAPAPLSKDEKNSLVVKITGHVSLAFTAYCDAVNTVAADVKAAAKKDAEMAALLIDVLMGIWNPFLAQELDAIAKDAGAIPDRFLGMLTSEKDAAKRNLDLATKTASAQAKQKMPDILSDETNFLTSLKSEFESRAHNIIDTCDSKSDSELFSLYLAYRNATSEGFLQEIRDLLAKFKTEVEPISGPETHGGAEDVGNFEGMYVDKFTTTTKAYWVDDSGSSRLALLVRTDKEERVWDGWLQPPHMKESTNYYLIKYIDPEMKALAIARTNQIAPPVEHVASKDLNTKG